jgi:anti-anti-sigma factor
VRSSFNIELRGSCLRMSGELDDVSAPATSSTVREFAAAHGTSRIELDLTDVTFIDSIGLRELLKLRNGFPGLHIVAVNPRIERLFAMTGTTELLLDEDSA